MKTEIENLLSRIRTKIGQDPDLFQKIEFLVRDKIITVKPGALKHYFPSSLKKEKDIQSQVDYNHPIRIGKWETRIISPNRIISSEEVNILCEEPDENGPWQSGGIEHLVTIFDQYPEEVCKNLCNNLVGLGSIFMIEDYKHVPMIGSLGHFDEKAGDDPKELYGKLSLNCYDGYWGPDDHFLSVRLVPS